MAKKTTKKKPEVKHAYKFAGVETGRVTGLPINQVSAAKGFNLYTKEPDSAIVKAAHALEDLQSRRRSHNETLEYLNSQYTELYKEIQVITTALLQDDLAQSQLQREFDRLTAER